MGMKSGELVKKNIMQDKKPINKEEQPHGLWVVHFSDGVKFYNGHYINGTESGFFEFDWFGIGNLEKQYYAK